MKRVFLVLLVCGVIWTPVRGNDAALREADLAWDRGDYVAALNAYLKLLSTDAESTLEPIALQTGELYTTIELTRDGTAPRFSPDNRHLAYETGSGLTRVVRLVTVDSPTQVLAEFPGFAANFSPDGSRLVHLRNPVAKEPQEDPPTPRIVVRDVASGTEREIPTPDVSPSSPMIAVNGVILFVGTAATGPAQIYSVTDGGAPRPMTDGGGDKTLQEINADGTTALVSIRMPGGRGRAGGQATPQTFGVLSLRNGGWTVIQGSAPSFAGDGRSFTYLARSDAEYRLLVADSATPAEPTIVRNGTERMDSPALSRDGSRVAFQLMPRDDWELFIINRDGSGEQRVTREIQHDLLPRFLSSNRLLGLIGEARHRRSYIYDLPAEGTGARVQRRRLFHNNTVRTIAPEYIWVASRDGARLLISAERDGDTVSAERGVYLVDLNRRVTREELRARLLTNLASEEALVQKSGALFAPLAAAVRSVVNAASVSRIYSYEKALYDFDSKHISQPGNALAAKYLFDTYTSFGYAPEYPWFETSNAADGRTANVIATLQGTVNPELVYIVSSHYDSVPAGPGADDDSSGTAALLETARILAKHPQPATIVFASFTGEESGLLGSREFVRRAIANKMRVVGALNNDMIGWANDHRLDNTIRYSNPGIRDIQHAAAMQFTRLITYDALYYKGTDAAAYYEAYGDIVGGIGSYPVLGNPHYHQAHDILETINHQLVTEVAKTTAATLMRLAASPSRLTELKVDRYQNGAATVSWKPSPEGRITGYIVSYGTPDQPDAHQLTVRKPTATVTTSPGSVISVKAVNANGLDGWDWARVTVR